MSTRTRWMQRRALALAVAAVGVVAIAGTAVAGHQTSGVKSYTGCLSSGDGVMIKIKEGNAPRSACTGGQVEAHFSGGDITAITAQVGGGLTGGGENGAVSLSIRRDCGNGQVVKWNGSAWMCATDSDSIYTAGTGLDLSGSEFSIEDDYRVKNTDDCGGGEFATGFDGNGTIQCSAPAPAAPPVWVKRVGRADAPQVVAGTDGPIIASLIVPAGSYLVHASLEAHDDDGGDDLDVSCFINSATGGEPAAQGGAVADSSEIAGHSIGISDVVTFAAAGEVRLRCQSYVGSDNVQSVRLSALRVGSVNPQ